MAGGTYCLTFTTLQTITLGNHKMKKENIIDKFKLLLFAGSHLFLRGVSSNYVLYSILDIEQQAKRKLFLKEGGHWHINSDHLNERF